MTATEVLRRYLDLVGRQQWDELAELYAADAVVEHPMNPGAPPLRGRTALRAHFARLRDLGLSMRATGLRVAPMADGETVVAEFSYRGTAGGTAFERRCVFVTTVRDGLIVGSRDYQADVTVSAGP